jgi:hypothetical protein
VQGAAQLPSAHGRWIVSEDNGLGDPRTWWLGNHARAAWYRDDAAAVLEQMPEEYWFVIVEMEPPYLVSVVNFDSDALAWGRVANRRPASASPFRPLPMTGPAIANPARTMTGLSVGLPPWPIYQLQDRGGRRVHLRADPRPRFAAGGAVFCDTLTGGYDDGHP